MQQTSTTGAGGLTSTTFTFSSTPRAVDAKPGPRFRDTAKASMMGDPRVRQQMQPGVLWLRGGPADGRRVGTAMAAGIAPPGQRRAAHRYTTQTGASGGATAASGQQGRSATATADTPPVQGRQHIDVQTEPYLEELADRPKEAAAETQTDEFLDRPPSPLFVPRKIGVDAETQVIAGELFDFDVEVEPILEVLVGKALDQAMTEVVEEDELQSLKQRQSLHEKKRAAELAEVQRLEEAEARREQEKVRRLEQERKRVEEQRAAQSQAAMRTIARSYVADFTKTVFTDLKKSGYFFDRIEKEVEAQFMPWLMESVDSSADQAAVSRTLVDKLIMSALENAVKQYEASHGQRDTGAQESAPAPAPAPAPVSVST
eukprot:m51a1_g11988 hypothetical protein (373) ;mRNA; f:881276-882662